MSNKKVAGTIILNLNDGSKKFLMHPIGEAIEFAMAKVSDEMTGLASMLQWFKEEVQLDVTSISLVELTNAHINKENVPLFVFEMDEQALKNEMDKWQFQIEFPSGTHRVGHSCVRHLLSESDTSVRM